MSAQILGVPSSRSFFFDGPILVSFNNAGRIFRSELPPGASDQWWDAPEGIESIVRLPNRSVAYLSRFDALFEVALNQAFYLLTDSVDEGGLAVHGPLIYAADSNALHLIDTLTGLQQQIVESPPWGVPTAITLDENSNQLLVLGSHTIWSLPLNPGGVPNGTPQVWRPLPDGLEQFNGGLAVDACGNTFVTATGGDGSQVLRYTPDDAEPTVAFEVDTVLSGLAFGSGEGGWEAETLYASGSMNSEQFFAIQAGIGGTIDTYADPEPDPEHCPDDSFEDNDSQATATQGFTSGSLTLTDEDWFEVNIPPGHRGFADFSLSAYTTAYWIDSDGDSESLGTATTGNFNEANPSSSVETMWLRFIEPSNLNECLLYDLSVTMVPLPVEDCADGTDNDLDAATDCFDIECFGDPACAGICPPEDALEDNDTIAEALAGVVSETGLMVHHQDPDFYEVQVAPGEYLQALLTWDEAYGPTRMALSISSGVAIDQGTAVGNTVSILYENPGSATWTFYLQVRTLNSACSSYDLEINGGPL